MRGLVIPVKGPIVEMNFTDGDQLGQLQQAVGGWIQALPLPGFIDPDGRATAYINEEGKIVGLPFNGRATDFLVPGVGLMMGDYISGPMVLLGFNPAVGENEDVPERVEKRVRLIESEAG